MRTYIGTKIVQAVLRKGYSTGLDEYGMIKFQPDGYIIKYPDGYESWSPKKVFEEAYRPIDALTFGLAIEALKKGHKVARKGWNGKKMWLKLQVPDAGSKMSLPYIYMKTADNHLVPWLASQTDMLAEDWHIIEEN